MNVLYVAIVVSANVRIIFDNATEAAEVGFPLSFQGWFQNEKIYTCTMDGDGVLSGAWHSGLSLRYNSDEFKSASLRDRA